MVKTTTLLLTPNAASEAKDLQWITWSNWKPLLERQIKKQQLMPCFLLFFLQREDVCDHLRYNEGPAKIGATKHII